MWQVREVVGQNPSLKRISIVGNSLGGLYARYAISMLYEAKDKVRGLIVLVIISMPPPAAPADGCFRAAYWPIQTIAGLEPQTFMTIASPHLGVRKYLGFPVSHRRRRVQASL